MRSLDSPDAGRALTDEGRKKVAEVVKAARRAGVEPSLIVSSPYVRAVETAQIAAEGFEYKGDIVRTEALVPHGSPEKVWAELRDYSRGSGHSARRPRAAPQPSGCVSSCQPGAARRNEEGGDGADRRREHGPDAARHPALDDHAETLQVDSATISQ